MNNISPFKLAGKDNCVEGIRINLSGLNQIQLRFMYTEFRKSAPPYNKEHVTEDLFNKKNLEENTLNV